MSKEKFHQSLEALFSDLQKDIVSTENHSPQGMAGWTWECDSAGIYIYCSPEIENFLGYSSKALVGKNFSFYCLTPDSSNKIFSLTENLINTSEVEVDYIDSSGNIVPVRLTINPDLDEKNRIKKLRGLSQLISPQMKNSNPELSRAVNEKISKSINTLLQFDKPPISAIGETTKESKRNASLIIRDQFSEIKSSTLTLDDPYKFLINLLDIQPEKIFKKEEKLLIDQVANQLVLAIENAQLIQKTQTALLETDERARELSILNEMSHALAAYLELPKILDNIYQYTSQLMDTSNFYIALYHPETDQIDFSLVYADNELVDNNHPEYSEWGNNQPVTGLTGFVIRQKQPLLLNQNIKEKLKKTKIDFIEVGSGIAESWLGVPMIIGDRVIGVISVQSEMITGLFNIHHQELLTIIANQAAIAIENARLLEETQKRNRELHAINTIIRAAGQSLDLKKMLDQVLTNILESIGVSAGYISVYDTVAKKLSIVSHLNLSDALSEKIFSRGIAGTYCESVFISSKPITYSNFSQINETETKGLLLLGIQSYIGIPIISRDSTLGTISLFDYRPFNITQNTIDLLNSIGQQLGVSIQNIHLFEQTQASLEETEELYQASSKINTAKSYGEILEALSQHTLLENADINTTIDLFDQPWTTEHTPEWIVVVSRRKKVMTGFISARYPLESFKNLNNYLRSDMPTIINDIESDKRLDKYILSILKDKFKARSVIFIPLVAGGRWIGYINGIYGKPINIPEKELRKIVVLSNQAATALQNIRLYGETSRRANQLQTAAEIAKDTSGTLALDELLNKSVNMVRERFGFYHASIFLLDDKGEYAVIQESTGKAGEEMKLNKHKLAVGSQSIVGYVTKRGEPLVINDVSKNSIHRPNPLLPRTCSELAIPLKTGSTVIGALDVQSTDVNAFTPDDIPVLQTLADQLAVAINNAKAFELSQNAIKEMRKADQLKSQFLANMSHELRTPLNSIIGFSRVILKGIDGPITDLQNQDLNAIYNSGQHLLNLINDILDLSKIEAGKMELIFEEQVNLNDLIQSTIPTVTGLIKDKPIKLHREIADNLPNIRADPTKIRQVLLNLLSNAAKFTEQGFISIQAKKHENPNGLCEIIISVTDTGSGISEQDQIKLFQPFSQVDASATRKTGGSGLGLSISRHLVELHGGKIGVISKADNGSTFYFTLPLTINHELTNLISNHPTANPLILSIESEEQVLNLYERYLHNHGYRFCGLSDLSKIFATIYEVNPMAITIDVALSIHNQHYSDGWDILKQLRNNPRTNKIPIIICTLVNDRAKGFEFGVDDYLLKPILEHDFISAIRKISHIQKMNE